MIWTVLGVSLGLAAAFCVAMAETLVGRPGFESHRMHIAAAIAIAGPCLWFIGVFLAKRRRNTQAEGEDPRFLLGDLRYWGPMLLVLATITLFIQPLRKKTGDPVPKPVAAVAVVAAAPVPPPPEPAPQPKPPVIFPRLRMQGVFFRDAQAFAIINGESYTVGDRLGEVSIKAIDRTSVLVELSGEVKLLTLN